MIRVELSEEERYCVFVLFGNGWGGSEEALLARDEAYEALELAKFERMDARVIERGLGKIPTGHLFDLTEEAASHLVLTITSNGQQTMLLGRASARMLRRLRLAMPRQPAEPPAAGREGHA